jgi:phage terminase large subunit-like protein
MVARNKSRYGKDQHNAILVTRQQASGSAKVDLPMAAVNTIMTMSTNPPVLAAWRIRVSVGVVTTSS